MAERLLVVFGKESVLMSLYLRKLQQIIFIKYLIDFLVTLSLATQVNLID